MGSEFIIAAITVFLGAFGTGWLYFQNEKKKAAKVAAEQELKRQREAAIAADRQRRQDRFNSLMPHITQVSKQMDLLKQGYLANYPYKQWLRQSSVVLDDLASLKYDDLKVSYTEKEVILNILSFKTGGDDMRKQHNTGIVNDDLKNYKTFFDQVADNPLDDQQRRAVITDEDNTLIVAGAGSGKTLTITGKVNYLLKRYQVNPSRILLISFTKKSVESLLERVKVDGIEVKTFHSFGLNVVGHALGYRPTIFNSDDYENRIGQLFENRLKKDEDFQGKAASFYIDGLRVERSNEDFKSKGEYYQHLKDQDFTTLKMAPGKGRSNQTLKRETVKSVEECKIANFLYLNNIDYIYEGAYQHPTATLDRKQYQPDFTIRQGDKIVYLEHFGINKEGKVPRWFAKNPNDEYSYKVAQKDYIDGIEWKRRLHAQHGTTLIETYSYKNDGRGNLQNSLLTKLQKAGIVASPKSTDEVWEIIKKVDDNGYKMLIKLMATFIALMKSNNIDFTEVNKKVSAIPDGSESKRTAYLCSLIEPIYDDYQEFLAENNQIDFSDMINLASQFIREGRYKKTYDYILIDEFQDTSVSRFRLIEVLKEQNPYCKLFCVGDDWQSIYRFAGSDIALISNFKKYFGVTEELKIETTYRYHEPLIKTSGDFILKNPFQSVKQLQSGSPGKETTFDIVYFNSFEPGQGAIRKLDGLLQTLQESVSGITQKKILFLGRYNFDINILKTDSRKANEYSQEAECNAAENESGVFRMSKNADKVDEIIYSNSLGELRMQFMSVHRAKGLEADIVILLNCSSGKHGFPAQLSDDPVLSLLLSDADQYENGEERRLFYVAMTRAKEQVFFLTDQVYKSKFIGELEANQPNSQFKKCPQCTEGDLVLRTGRTKEGRDYAFYGCTNFSYGCDYSRNAKVTEQ